MRLAWRHIVVAIDAGTVCCERVCCTCCLSAALSAEFDGADQCMAGTGTDVCGACVPCFRRVVCVHVCAERDRGRGVWQCGMIGISVAVDKNVGGWSAVCVRAWFAVPYLMLLHCPKYKTNACTLCAMIGQVVHWGQLLFDYIVFVVSTCTICGLMGAAVQLELFVCGFGIQRCELIVCSDDIILITTLRLVTRRGTLNQ